MRTKIAVYIEDGLLVCYIRFRARDGALLCGEDFDRKKSTTPLFCSVNWKLNSEGCQEHSPSYWFAGENH